ncbi:MAG: NUDIX hydrolase [Myxococcales bacterium]|nr:NUDIX hydrolase [Myxococcales bacterium]
MRHSNVVYTLIRLPIGGVTHLLLRRHAKWGDWSLVGGHVEEWELEDWRQAAAREATEELEPLVDEQDFTVAPLHDEPITWGPEASRSARGERTLYRIQYYRLVFVHDPVELLARLPQGEFLLVPEHALDSTEQPLGNPVHRARRYLREGLSSVPLSWGEDLDPRALPAGLRPVTVSAAPPV